MVTRRALLASLAGVPLSSLVAARTAFATPVPTGGRRAFPNVPLVTQDNQQVLFYDDLMRGKTVVLSFFYTQCEGICPATTANLVKEQELLGDRLGRDVFMYSISLKPRQDTPRALKGYAADYGIRPGWTLLTGRPADCERLRRKLGFVDPDPRVDADTSQHVGVIVYGSEPLDHWSACPAQTEPSEIVKYISWVEA